MSRSARGCKDVKNCVFTWGSRYRARKGDRLSPHPTPRPHISACPPPTPPGPEEKLGASTWSSRVTGHLDLSRGLLRGLRVRTRLTRSPSDRQRALRKAESAPALGLAPLRWFAPSLGRITIKKHRVPHHRPALFPPSHSHPPASSHVGLLAVPQRCRHSPASFPPNLPVAPSLTSCMSLLTCHLLKEVFPSHLIPGALMCSYTGCPLRKVLTEGVRGGWSLPHILSFKTQCPEERGTAF